MRTPQPGPCPMTHHLAELATRWQSLAERHRDHLLFLRERYRRYDAAQLDVLISRAERNLAGWTALTGANKRGDDIQGDSEERPCGEPSPSQVGFSLPARVSGGRPTGSGSGARVPRGWSATASLARLPPHPAAAQPIFLPHRVLEGFCRRSTGSPGVQLRCRALAGSIACH
jgi:hypothetical protein